MPDQPARAVLYLRVSTFRQERGASIGTQRATLTDWVVHLARDGDKFPSGLVLRSDLEYQDAKSGKDGSRAAFSAMIAAAKAGQFEYVLCFDPDRFARDLVLTMQTIDDLFKYGVKVYFYNLQHLDIYSADGRSSLQQVAMFAEQMRLRHGHRMRAAMQAKMFSRREWVGRPPFGWRVCSTPQGHLTKSVLEQDSKEWAIVQTIFLHATTNQTYSSIAAELNSNPHLYPTRAAKRWTGNQVSAILNHPRTRKAVRKERKDLAQGS